MTATLATQHLAGLPCGNCGTPIPPLDMVRALLFETLDELPDSLRAETLNYATCSACGFGGRVWPGFICADLKRGRTLFVYNQLESIRFTDETLSDALAYAATQMPDGQAPLDPDAIAYLSHYRDLLTTLLLPDADFAELVALDRDYYRRRRLPSDEARAARFIDDTLALGVFTRFADERTPEYLSACIGEIDRRLADDPERAERPALEWLKQTVADLLEDALRAGATPPSPPPPDTEDPPNGRSFSGRLDGDLRRFVTEEARAYSHRVAELAAPAILREMAPRLDHLVFTPPPGEDQDIEAIRQARLDALAEPIVRVQSLYPEGFVFAEGREMMHSHALVARAAAGERDLQKALTDLVARDHRGRDPALREATIALFVEIAERFGDIEAAILAWCVAAQQLEDIGAEAAHAAALCKAIETLHLRGRHLPIGAHTLEFIALSCRALAGMMARRGMLDITALCLGEAAKDFAWLGRTEQELECRIDLLQLAPSLSSGPIDTSAAEALLARIDAAGLKDAWEKRCRLGMMVGDALLRQAPALPIVMTYFNQRLAPTDWDDSDSPASMRLYNPNQRRPAHGQIMVMCSEDDPWAISTLQMTDVPWLDQYEAVIAAALDHGPSEAAATFMLQTAGQGISLGMPEIARYQLARLERVMADGWGEQFAPLALASASMFGRDLRLAGIDPTTHAPFERAVERALELASREPERTLGNFVVPDASIARQLGELLELLGRHEDAIHWHVEGSRRASAALAMTWNPHHRHAHEADVVRGYWRAARTAAKQALAEPSPEARGEALSWAEAARRYAVRLKLADQPAEGENQDRALPTRLPAPAVHYALLQETELNDGFWMIALQEMDGSVSELIVQDMEEVHKALEAVSALFQEAREGAASAMLADLAERERARLPAYHEALEALADLLLPAPISSRFDNFERLTIIPEAYLWDVPWAALRVANENSERGYLHAVNGKDGPLRLCAAPNLEIAAQSLQSLGSATSGISRMHAAPIAWRHDLAPVFGLGPAIDGTIARLGGKCGPVTHVPAGTQGFRDLLEAARLAIFSGHGEATDRGDLELIVQDGRLGAEEIQALWPGRATPAAQAVLLCACAGVRSFYAAGMSRRELAGAHVQLVRQGVRFVLGSTQPLSVVAAAAMAEHFLNAAAGGAELDEAASAAVGEMADDAMLFSPLFWGGIIGFGRGDFTIAQQG